MSCTRDVQLSLQLSTAVSEEISFPGPEEESILQV